MIIFKLFIYVESYSNTVRDLKHKRFPWRFQNTFIIFWFIIFYGVCWSMDFQSSSFMFIITISGWQVCFGFFRFKWCIIVNFPLVGQGIIYAFFSFYVAIFFVRKYCWGASECVTSVTFWFVQVQKASNFTAQLTWNEISNENTKFNTILLLGKYYFLKFKKYILLKYVDIWFTKFVSSNHLVGASTLPVVEKETIGSCCLWAQH